MESPWSGTGVFPGGGANAPYRTQCAPPAGTGVSPKHTHRFQAACGKHGTSNGRADRDRNTHLSPFSNRPENQYARVQNSGSERKKGRSYHKTITVVFSPCFFQKRHDQGPNSHNVGHDYNKFGHCETARSDGLLQRRSRSHPVATLSPLQPVHDELCHGVRIQSSKNTRRSLLKATFEEAQIEQRILDQLLLIPAAQEVHICLHKSMGTPLYRHHTNIWTNCVNDAP